MEMAGVDQRLVAAVLAALEQQGYRVEAPAAAQEATCTVAEMWTAWAVWAEQHLKSWRAKRYHNRCLLRTIVGGRPLGEYRWDEVTPGVCDEYRRVREGTKSLFGRFVKPNTVNGELVTLQMIFTWHVSEGKIPRNPMKGWKREDEKKYRRQTYLGPEEFKTFCEAGPPIFQDMLWVAYRCIGMRHAEVRYLQKSEIDHANKLIHLPGSRTKNGEPRTIPVPDDAMEIIERRARESRGPYVFVAPTDPKRQAPVSQSTMWRWLDKARRISGVKGINGENIVIHHARHGGITTALEVAPPGWVSDAAGASLRIIDDVYSKFAGRQQEGLRRLMNEHGRVGPKPSPDTSAPDVVTRKKNGE